MEFNFRSKQNLKGVHPIMVKILETSLQKFNDDFYFIVTEGVRTLERQKQLLAEKKTMTLDSYHLSGHAVDIAIFRNKALTWEYKEYKAVSLIITQTAKDLGYDIVWGGNFKSFIDAVHYQIDRNKYKWKLEK